MIDSFFGIKLLQSTSRRKGNWNSFDIWLSHVNVSVLQSTSRRKGNWNLERLRHIDDLRYYCKAHPDEKGIETRYPSPIVPSDIFHCKAHPDEKGIETRMGNCWSRWNLELQSTSRRKGNWNSSCTRTQRQQSLRIAKHIPTKRELKLSSVRHTNS